MKTMEKNKKNPNICKSCGWVKAAGKCINKNCKLRGKLQGGKQ